MWTISNDSAWIEAGPNSYRHYCGACITKNGRLWTATTAVGGSVPGHKTAVETVSNLMRRDPDFRFFGKWGPHVGTLKCGDVYHRLLPSGTIKGEGFVFCTSSEGKFPEFLTSVLSKYFLGVATCVGCSKPMSSLQMQKHSQFDGLCDEQNLYLSCDCGHPVWQMESESYNTALWAIRDAMTVPRMRRLKAAGGNHSRDEIQAILALQSYRCIYCHAPFTEKCPPSRDHLLSVSSGGSDWALNIVMACKRCNASRGNIPFRTFCKLLSPKQNQRIRVQLRSRLLAVEINQVADEAFACFVRGLALHDPKHGRYLDIQRMRATARLNARTNRVLPRSVASILKKSATPRRTL